ncbi:MAG: hypothetical protein M3Q15_04540, partial [Pseudomonadota bacterium]|nr:hypothetical protein [Pseudomonadota bacterium]
CASGVAQAFDCMGGRAQADAAELGAHVRRASPHKGPWPRVSVWQGSADHTVVPSNADAIVLQWTHLHGLPPAPTATDSVEGYPRRLWQDAKGAVLVEQYSITGMAHGTPLMPGTDAGESGAAGAHMLDAAISSTDRIAAFFGIAPLPAAQTKPKTRKRAAPKPLAPTGVQAVIENALKSAGLMR